MQASTIASEVHNAGFAVVRDGVPEELVSDALCGIGRVRGGAAILSRSGAVYGVRDLLRNVPEVSRLSQHPEVAVLARSVLGPDAFIARALYFDKPADANWAVPWHQDVTIAVRDRCEAPGYGPWSIKAGVHHVRPPASVLERMLAIRIHLDDCGSESGPLMVIPGTHVFGILPDARVDSLVAQSAPVVCTCPARAIIAMRPLLLHASDRAASPAHRRVIHLEFATGPLAPGLEWARAMDPT